MFYEGWKIGLKKVHVKKISISKIPIDIDKREFSYDN